MELTAHEINKYYGKKVALSSPSVFLWRYCT